MNEELLTNVRKIYELLELLAEDKIAERDAKQRSKLREIAGVSKKKQAAALLMDGSRPQKDIAVGATIAASHLSTLVSELSVAGLIVGDKKVPKLTISVPPTFFETHKN